MDGCEILHQLVTIGISIKPCRFWDYRGTNHIPTGAGFLPSTVCGSSMLRAEVTCLYIYDIIYIDIYNIY